MARKKQKNEVDLKSCGCLIIIIILFILLFNAPKEWFDPNGTLKTQEANKQATKTVVQKTNVAAQQTSTVKAYNENFTCRVQGSYTVTDLLTDLNSRDSSRAKKYQNKCFYLSGIISRWEFPANFAGIINLVDEKGKDDHRVIVRYDNAHEELIWPYKIGDSVTVLVNCWYAEIPGAFSFNLVNVKK